MLSLASQTRIPPQEQPIQPGHESLMRPKPKFQDPDYKGSDKLLNKVAIITGGDSGIGRAVAVAFAIEGADVVISYLNEHEDAAETQKIVEKKSRTCLTLAGNIQEPAFCQKIIDETIKKFGKLDILVNNAAEQYPQDDFLNISDEQLEKTFRTNIFSFFYMTRRALPHMRKGSNIINTASVTAYKGSDHLVDYAATKGAIVSFTRSLSENLIKKGIRVNAVAPGPVWTPLIPASFSAKEVAEFGKDADETTRGAKRDCPVCIFGE